MTHLYVTPFHCSPKPEICRPKPVPCRPAQEHSRHEPVTDCRPEPPCAVTEIPKREKWDGALGTTEAYTKVPAPSGVNRQETVKIVKVTSSFYHFHLHSYTQMYEIKLPNCIS